MAQGFRILLVALALSVAPFSVAQESASGMELVSHNLPVRLDIDQTFRVDVVLRNTGTRPWSRNNTTLGIKPASTEQGWGVTKIELAPEDATEPGETLRFQFDITAPAVPDTYPFTLELASQDNGGSATVTPTTIIVEDPSVRGIFVSQLLPDQLAPGEKFKAFIQYRNTGKSSWSRSQGYRLAAVAPDSLKNWGTDKVELEANEHVLPGQTATFAFAAVAPAVSGQYPFQWQLYQDGRRFFGDMTPATTVRIGPAQANKSEMLDAEFVSTSVPDRLQTDTTYTVTILFKNTGQIPWRGGLVALKPQGASSNLTWFTDRVDLAPGEVVEPGDIKGFEFNIHTPVDAGKYAFQWRLTNERDEPFGDASEPRRLTVEEKSSAMPRPQ